MTSDNPLDAAIDRHLHRHEEQLAQLKQPGPELSAPAGREGELEALVTARATTTERAASAHQSLLEFARDPRARDLLHAVLDDPDEARAAAADPVAYARDHDLELPADLQVTVEAYGDEPRVLLVSTDPVTPFVARATRDDVTLFEST